MSHEMVPGFWPILHSQGSSHKLTDSNFDILQVTSNVNFTEFNFKLLRVSET